MTDRIATLASRLRQKGEATAAYFRALQPEDWSATVYTEGSAWDARQVLCHFVSAEQSLLVLFENVAAGGEGAPEDFDVDRFNESQVRQMDGLTPDELISRFEACRAATVSFAEGLEEADLDRVGRHPFLGVDRLEAFLKLIYRHNMLHERDIRRALDGGA